MHVCVCIYNFFLVRRTFSLSSFSVILQTCLLSFSRWAFSGMETEADNMLGIQVTKFAVFNETEENNHRSTHSSIVQ